MSLHCELICGSIRVQSRILSLGEKVMRMTVDGGLRRRPQFVGGGGGGGGLPPPPPPPPPPRKFWNFEPSQSDSETKLRS